MESKKSLADIARDPENWTEEDIADIKKLNESLSELKDFVEPYAVRVHHKNDADLSLKYYKEYSIMAGVLETFILNDKVSFKDLLQSIHDNTVESLYFNLTNVDTKTVIKKMIRLGYIIASDLANKHNPVFTITEIGIEHSRQQTLQNLAATSFANHLTFRLSKRAERMNFIMLVVTIVSLVIAVCSVYVTIKVST